MDYHGDGYGARDKAIEMDFPYIQPMTSQKTSRMSSAPLPDGAEDTEAPGFTATAGRKILLVFVVVVVFMTGLAIGLYIANKGDDDVMDHHSPTMPGVTTNTTTGPPTTTTQPTTSALPTTSAQPTTTTNTTTTSTSAP